MPAETEKQTEAGWWGERERERSLLIRSERTSQDGENDSNLTERLFSKTNRRINKWNDETFDDVFLINHHLTHTVDSVCSGLIVCAESEIKVWIWKLTRSPDQWLCFESNPQTHEAVHHLIKLNLSLKNGQYVDPTLRGACGEVRSSLFT